MDPLVTSVFNSLLFNFTFGFVVLVILFLISLLIILVILRRVHYEKSSIQTVGELKFYKVLKYALQDYDVLAQVRLATIVHLPPKYFLWSRFSELGSKTVDFVICDKETGETLLVIELDDSSHRRADRIKRDKYVDKVLKGANIQVLHYGYQNYYDSTKLRAIIMQSLQTP